MNQVSHTALAFAYCLPFRTRSLHLECPLRSQSTFLRSTVIPHRILTVSWSFISSRPCLRASASSHDSQSKETDILITPNSTSPAKNNGQHVENTQLDSDGKPSLRHRNEAHSDADVEAKQNILAGLISWALSSIKRLFAPGGFVWGVATGVSLSLLVFVFQWSTIGDDSLLREKVTLFDFILQDINTSYVEKVDINRLFETGVNSMLGTLDPYTQFENNTQAAEMSVKTNGRYAGVGLGIGVDDRAGVSAKEKKIVVVSAFEGYAFDAGLRPGDVIDTVADQSVEGLSLEKVTDMLRGEPGTVVNLSVRREGVAEPLSFSLSRKSIRIKDVPAFAFAGNPDDRIGYIRLQSFAKDAASEVRLAIQELTESSAKSGQQLNGLVLDLRGNPGGLLNAAIEVAELFVPRDSVIVSTKGRGLGPNPTYVSSKQPVVPSDLPLAVLVNGQTASASEIVAGAIQDLDHGVIVGSRTFGKGLVQNVQELPFNTALKYTVGKYYTPSGRCIQSVNYEQANGDGPFEIKKIEESERKEFTTIGGRIVRDGGGIEPDVEVLRRPSFLEQALYRQNMYFRFASRFAVQVKGNQLSEDFVLGNDIYRDFVKFVASSEFKYESRFDDAFDQLNNMFDELGYSDARSKVLDLKEATEAEMKTDFMRHEKAIRSQVESAIRYRFQPDSQRIIAELKNDDQLSEAIKILKNRDDYQNLLSISEENSKADETSARSSSLVT